MGVASDGIGDWVVSNLCLAPTTIISSHYTTRQLTTKGPTTEGPTTDGPTTDGPTTEGQIAERPPSTEWERTATEKMFPTATRSSKMTTDLRQTSKISEPTYPLTTDGATTIVDISTALAGCPPGMFWLHNNNTVYVTCLWKIG